MASMGGIVVNRYQQYKAGTKKFTTWLVSAASIGRDLSDTLGALKAHHGTASRSSPQAPALEIKSHELVRLAEIVISAVPTVDVPNDIMDILDSVIDSRSASHAWYTSTYPSSTQNAGHAHFIDKLHRVKHLLQPLATSPSGHIESGQTKRKKKKNGVFTGEMDKLANMFDHLDIEQPSVAPLGTSPILQDVVLGEDVDNASLALWCFLADLNDIRIYVRTLWLEYQAGALSLATAGMVTEIATGMMLQADQEFTKAWPQHKTWFSIMAHLDVEIYVNNNISYTRPKSSAGATQHTGSSKHAADLLCVSAGLLLSTLQAGTAILAKEGEQMVADVLAMKKRLMHMPRPASLLENPLLSILPDIESQHRNFEQVTSNPDFARCQSTFGIGLCRISANATGDRFQAPMWLVVACAIHMDIQEIVASQPRCASDALLQTTTSAISSMDRWLELVKAEKVPGLQSNHHAADSRELKKIADIVQKIVIRGQELDKSRHLQPLPSKPGPVSLDLGTLGPTVYKIPQTSALIQCSLHFQLTDFHMNVANNMVAILIMAHLYKAARHYGLMTAAWHDMDFVIAQSSWNKTFGKVNGKAGPYALLKRFLVDVGVDPSATAGSRVPGPPSLETVFEKAKRIGRREDGFRSNFWARKSANELTGDGSTDPIPAVLASLTDPGLASGTSKQRRFTSQQLLSTLKRDLITDEPSVNFDWLGFTAFCLEKLIVIFTLSLDEAEAAKMAGRGETGFAYILLKSAADCATISDSLERLQRTQMGKAASWMQESISDVAVSKQFSQKAFGMCSGKIPKTLRPNFEPPGVKGDLALAEIAMAFPGSSIGHLRKTIDIFDPDGSYDRFEQILNLDLVQKDLMLGGKSGRYNSCLIYEKVEGGSRQGKSFKLR